MDPVKKKEFSVSLFQIYVILMLLLISVILSIDTWMIANPEKLQLSNRSAIENHEGSILNLKGKNKKVADLIRLTITEEITVRQIVYGGVSIGHEIKDGLLVRKLVVRSELFDLHRQKRVPTLTLLLEIIKGGRPIDANSAWAYFIALEEGPVAAREFAGDGAAADFDREDENDGNTLRNRIVRNLEKME